MNIIPGVGEALTALRPKCEFMLQGSTYADILWLDKDQTIPTEDDVTAKVTELVNAYPMKLLREERNRRLQATDWRASSDLTLSGDWKAHRQDLRDLPNQQTPKLNSDGELDPTSISWPPEPSS